MFYPQCTTGGRLRMASSVPGIRSRINLDRCRRFATPASPVAVGADRAAARIDAVRSIR